MGGFFNYNIGCKLNSKKWVIFTLFKNLSNRNFTLSIEKPFQIKSHFEGYICKQQRFSNRCLQLNRIIKIFTEGVFAFT